MRIRGPRARGAALLALGAAASLALPSAAGAATRVVEAGPFAGSADDFQEAVSDANAYFRKVTTIRRGDRVRWDVNGFHTVTFVPRGGREPELIIPNEDAGPVSGVNDAAGNPFWFNGAPNLMLNPAVAAERGGENFRPSRVHNSGLPLEEGERLRYTLEFNRTGRFRYICVVHPGMDGTIRVRGRRAAIPSAAAHRRQAKREQRVLLRQAKRLTTGVGTSRLQNTLQAGNDNRDGVSIFKFFPASAQVSAGTTLTLRMSPRTTEAHTFTFGPEAYLQPMFGLIAPGPEGTFVVDPRAAYPSENPQSGTPSYTGSNHGNGFYNSGVLDRDPDSPQPASVRLQFTTAGTYQYVCLIHPFMRGQVTVTG